MTTVASIVEGDGEVKALPILLRRIAEWKHPETVVHPLPPIRVRRDRFLNRDDEFRRQLLLAAAKCGDMGWILVVLDADDDCPATLGAGILERARQYVPHRRLSVVLAKREFEAWFIASSQSLHGLRGFRRNEADAEVDAEWPRDAKGWIGQRMDRPYREVLDQPAFSAQFDLQQAHDRSCSFRKLCGEWQRQVQP